MSNYTAQMKGSWSTRLHRYYIALFIETMKDGLARNHGKLNTMACLSVPSACHNKGEDAHVAKEAISSRGLRKAVLITSPLWLCHKNRCRNVIPQNMSTPPIFSSLLSSVISFHFCLLQMQRIGPCGHIEPGNVHRWTVRLVVAWTSFLKGEMSA